MSHYDGFEEFVAAQGAALSRAAYFLTGSDADAEDLLQEALARTAGRWPRIAASGNATAYVRQVMLNHTRSVWRRGRLVRFIPSADLPDRPRPDDVTPAVEDRISLGAALRQIGPRQRAVLYLRYYEDLTETESARLLGCSVGTVKSQAHDALTRLRRIAPELAPENNEVVE